MFLNLVPAGEDWASEIDQDEHHNLGDILEVEDLENSLGGVQNLYAGFEAKFKEIKVKLSI